MSDDETPPFLKNTWKFIQSASMNQNFSLPEFFRHLHANENAVVFDLNRFHQNCRTQQRVELGNENVAHQMYGGDQTSRQNRVLTDAATKTVWYTDEGHSRIPGILRAVRPLSHQDYTYFEIEILSSGKSGAIAIGLVPDGYKNGNQPGWKQGSVGYHADDGGIFIANGSACKLKEKCTVGDKMGCGIEIKDGRQFVYFTRNGLSVAEQPFGANETLYPAVGMNSPGEKVRLLGDDIWGLNNDSIDEEFIGDTDDGDDDTDNSDVTILPETGHISYLWKNAGHGDVILAADVPFSRDKSYFEFEVFSMAEGSDLSIGFIPVKHPKRKHPGWIPGSIGFHLAEGEFFVGSRLPLKSHLEKFSIGDKIGCGLEYNRQDTNNVYFTKNGTTFFEREVSIPDVVYPVVGLKSSAGKTVSVCLEDCESWGYKMNNPKLQAMAASSSSCDDVIQSSASSVMCSKKPSAIVCEMDSLSANLKEVPGKTTTATLIAKKNFSKENSYFAVEYLEGSALVVGAVPLNYNLEELPGCFTNSIAYHSDDGGIYQSTGRANMFVRPCNHGDVVGCGLSDQSTDCQAVYYFTLNCETLCEVAFGSPNQRLFPAIGMKSENGPTIVMFQSDAAIWDHTPPTAPAPGPTPALPLTPAQPVPPPINEQAKANNRLFKELQCPICWNIMKKPKLFPCLQHSFCLVCLSEYAQSFAQNRQIPCPVCRKNFPLPRRGVDEFQNSAQLSRIIDVFNTTGS